MPTYDYECNGCRHTFEIFQAMSEEALRKCPECGKRRLRRLFGTGAALVFRGSGFYQTDYRSDSYKKAAEADKKSTSDSPSDKPKATDGNSAKKEPARQPKEASV